MILDRSEERLIEQQARDVWYKTFKLVAKNNPDLRFARREASLAFDEFRNKAYSSMDQPGEEAPESLFGDDPGSTEGQGC